MSCGMYNLNENTRTIIPSTLKCFLSHQKTEQDNYVLKIMGFLSHG